MERKTIQSLIAYYHHQSNKKRKLLYPNDTSFTAADFVQFRIRPDTSIIPFGSATEQDQKEADEFMKKIKPRWHYSFGNKTNLCDSSREIAMRYSQWISPITCSKQEEHVGFWIKCESQDGY